MSTPGDRPFGREAELAAIDRLVTAVRAGAGRVLMFSGEAGIGKSRLAAEAARAAAPDARALWGRCRESDATPPLWPWRQILHQLGHPWRGNDGESSGDPGHAQFHQFVTIAEVIAEAARARPLLIVIEDVHRADDASISMLSFIGDALLSGSIGLVVTYRAAELSRRALVAVDDLGRSVAAETRALAGLGPTEVRDWLANRGVLADARRIADQTSGNPLLVSEVLRHLGEGGALGEVPSSIGQVARARLAQLPENVRATVLAAAVLGRDFDYAPLAMMRSETPATIVDDLDLASRSGLLARSAERPGRYRFVHALIHQAVATSTSAVESADLHHHALAALRDTGWTVAADLAQHAVHALPLLGPGAVATYADQAAHEARRLLAWSDVVRWSEVALELSPEPATLDRRYDLACALLFAGQVERARTQFADLAEASRSAGQSSLLARCALRYGDSMSEVNFDSKLLAVLDAALAEPGLDPDDRIAVLARRARATYWVAGQQAQSQERSAIAVRLARARPNRKVLAAALIAHQFTLRGPDHLAERLTAGHEALEIASDLGDPELRFRALQWLVPDQFQSGDVAAASISVAALNEIAEAQRDPLLRWWVLVFRGLLAGFADAPETESLIEEAARLGARLSHPAARAYRMGQLTRLRWRTGSLRELEPELRAVIAEFPGLPTLRCDLALVLAAKGDRAPARALLRALVADDFGALPRDSLFLASLGILGEVAVSLGARTEGAAVFRGLRPYADVNLIQGVPVGWGAASWHLARLAQLCNDDSAPTFASDADRCHELWGGVGWGAALADRPDKALSMKTLSKREFEVLARLAAGSTNQQIATALVISVHTVERHVANIFTKIGARNRAEATAWAHRHRLVD